MLRKWTKRQFAAFTAHFLVLSLLLYPTVMELFRRDFATWSRDGSIPPPAYLTDGNFANGELFGDQVLYRIDLGPFVIPSLLQ